MEYLFSIDWLTRSKAKKQGMVEIICPNCDKMNYIIDDVRPVYCRKCGYDLTKKLNEKPIATN